MFTDIITAPDRNILVRRVISSVSKPETAIITQLYIDNIEQLIMPLDAYYFSARLVQELREKFLTEYGLVGKTHDEIDDYLDNNELSMPDPCRFDLPTISSSRKIRIVGKFEEHCVLTFTGLSL